MLSIFRGIKATKMSFHSDLSYAHYVQYTSSYVFSHITRITSITVFHELRPQSRTTHLHPCKKNLYNEFLNLARILV